MKDPTLIRWRFGDVSSETQPPIVLEKAPSADLWAGQTDEGELGFTYEEADLLLHAMIDDGLGDGQLAALGFAVGCAPVMLVDGDPEMAGVGAGACGGAVAVIPSAARGEFSAVGAAGSGGCPAVGPGLEV